MMQVIQQTDEEKLAMYMKLSKKEIAQMLINCNNILENMKPDEKVVTLKATDATVAFKYY